MTSFFRHISFFSLVVLTSSCDCLQNVTGTVVDKETNKPLDNVQVQKYNAADTNYTDNSGNFKLRSISGGLCGCPPMKVTATKTGYETVTTKIKNNRSKTIYLIKTKK